MRPALPPGFGPKVESPLLECAFQGVTQQLALSLVHNHCGLPDLQNRREVWFSVRFVIHQFFSGSHTILVRGVPFFLAETNV